MEIEGIDRLVIGVKDLDKAMEFFHNVLGIEFKESKHSFTQLRRVRSAAGKVPQKCTLKIELIQPVHPLKDADPPNTAALAQAVDKFGAALYAVTFKVKNVTEAAAEVGGKDVHTYARYEHKEGPFFNMKNYKAEFIKPEEMLGIRSSLVEFDESAD